MTHTILAIVIAAAVLVFGLAWLNDSQANKIEAQARAQATIIQANSTANATLMLAAFPMVLAVGGSLAAVLVGAAVLVLAVRWQPKRVIEQRVVFQVGPGTPRRELWQALSDTRQIEPIKGNYETLK